MPNPKIIMPLPNTDFDPGEAAIPWKIVTEAGYQVVFATPDGTTAVGDQMMLTGEGLDPWGWIPVLKKVRLIGLMLRSNGAARAAYAEMIQDSSFQNPDIYSDLKIDDYGGMILPGGHAAGIRQYLEDKILQNFVVDFFENIDTTGKHKPVAAVCHGVVVPTRAISKSTGKSVLYGKRTTALTWKLEKSAWKLTKYFARFWDPDYYRTYMEEEGEPDGYRSVEHEVIRALKDERDFIDVPSDNPDYAIKTSGLHRDSTSNSRPAWIVQDGNYLSARWPGDVHTLALEFIKCLVNHKP